MSQPTAPVTLTLAVDAAQVSVNQTSLVFTPQNWNDAQSVQVTAVDDAIDEADLHTSQITHTTASSDPNYNQATAPFRPLPTVTVRITDNDTAGVAITPTTVEVTEGGASTNYSVRLLSEPTAPVSITLAFDAAQVSVNRSSLTFTPQNWNDAQSVQVTAVDDAIDEADLHLSFITHTTASADPNYNQATARFTPLPTVTVRITDNDTAGVTITPTTVEVAEGGDSASYAVRLLSQPTAPVTITLVRDAAQVSVNQTSLVFTPGNWNTAQSVQVTAVDDAIDEADLHLSFITHTTASADPNYNQPTAPFRPLPTVTVRITDNDTAGVAITPTTLDVTEGGASVSYSVRLLSEPTAPVTITLVRDAAQVRVNRTTVSFTPQNWNTAQSVQVTAVDDAIDEADVHTSQITHTTASRDPNYNQATAPFRPLPTVTVRITDNDTAGVAITPTTLDVTEGGASASYSVRLLSEPTAPVTITLAVDAAQVSVNRNSLTFTPGNWSITQTVQVTAVDDAIDEADVHLSVITHTTASADPNYHQPTARFTPLPTVTVRITDNDTAGVDITPTTVEVAEGGASASYAVRLLSEPTAPVTITLVRDAAQVSANRTTVSFTPGNWNTAQSVQVTAVDDAIDEADVHTSQITHTTASADPNYNQATAPFRPLPTVTVRITDNDTAGVTITPTTVEVAEGGASASYAVRLLSEPTAPVTITLVRDAAQVSVNRSSLTFTPQNWNTAQTVQVTAVDDAIDEADVHLSFITHTTASADPNYNQATAPFRPLPTVTVRITDNDTAGVTITPTTVEVAEGGDSASYAVRLLSQPTAPVTITLAVDAAQVSVNRNSLTFTPGNWSITQTVQVTAVDDAIDEADVHLSVITHTTASADPNYHQPMARFTPLPTVTVRITDNDTAGVTITPTTVEVTEGGASASYSVRLLSQPTAPVTLTLVRDTAQVSANRTTVSFTPGNWNVAQSVQVTAVDDAIDEADLHLSLITHTMASADPNYNQATARFTPLPTVTVRITDNDTAGVAITPTTLDVTEGGASASYSVRLESEPTAPVTLTLAVDAAQVNVSRTTVSFTPQNWNTAQSVQVTAVDDAIDEADVHLSLITHTTASADPNYNQPTARFTPLPTVTVRITDNDTAGVDITPTTVEVAEGGDSASYAVRLLSQPTAPVTLTLAVDAAQVSVNQTSLVFTPQNWNTAQSVQVTAVDDAIDEADLHLSLITHTMASADPNYNQATARFTPLPTVTVRITDNDTAGVAITPTTLDVTEGGASASYSVRLESQPTAPVTITLVRDTAQVSANRTTVSFTPGNWNTAQSVQVTAVDDAIDEADVHTSQITHTTASADPNYNQATAPFRPLPTVTVRITDNDTAGVAITPTTVNVAEGGDSASYAVRLLSQPTAPVTLTLAYEGAQVNVSRTTVSFTPQNWNTAQTVQVTAVDDAIDEADVHLSFITHTTASRDPNYNQTTAPFRPLPTVTVRITDNDTAGVAITPTTLTVEEGRSATYTVELTSQPTTTVTVNLTVPGGVTTSASSLAFTAANWTAPQTVTVTATENAIAEGDRSVTIRHAVASTAFGYAGLAVAPVAVTITDNDMAGVTITPTALTVVEGASGTYTVTLTSQPTTTVTVNLTVPGGVTTSASSLAFTAANWTAPQTVTVTATENAIAEGDRSVTIRHAVASTAFGYAGLAVAPVAVTITDNDMAGVTITPTALTVVEGASGTYTVTLTSQPTTTVTVNLTVPGGVTTSASSLAFTAANWTAPQTVTVTATENAIAEGERVATIRHAVASTAFGYAGLAVDAVGVTITDNDTAGFILSESTVALAEGAVFTYTVELTSQPTATVTLNLNQPATLAVTPTILSFTDRDWGTPQTVTVTALDDDIARGERTLTITHTITSSDPVYAALNAPVVEVTVSDDDTAGLTVLPPTLALSEDPTALDNTGVFSLTLETQPLADVTITLTPDGQVDVAPSSLVFTVDRWNVPQNVTVTAVDDAIVEPSPHTGVITITSISTDASYNRTWPDYTVSITDNDVAGIEVVAPSGQFTSEDGDFVTMTLRLTSQPTDSVSIDVTSSDVSEGVVSAASGLPLVFDAANWNVPQIVTITGVDDDLFDGLQAYTIEVQPAVSADPNYANRRPDPASFALSNTDNERTRVSIGDAGAAVENTLRYPLTLTRPISDAIDLGLEIILINTLDGTSSVFATATHRIVADAITSTINLEVVRPQFAQPGILVAVRLTSITTPSAQAVLGNSQGLGWVEPAPVTIPTVRFAQAEALVTIGNTGTATVRLEVVLDVVPTVPVTVGYDLPTGDSGTADAADYTFTPGSLTFNTGQISQTIDVTINDRPSSQLYKTLRIGLTNPSNATLGDPNIATITIVYNQITWPNDVTGYVGYMFTAGPDIPAERGYYYINNVTLANGREGYSYAFIGVPCSWDQTSPLSIQLFSPGLHNSANTLDTILNTANNPPESSNLRDAGNTFFELYGPGTELGPAVNMPGPGADGSLGQQIFAPTASAEQWQTVWTIDEPACGRYILRSATEGDDMNNWAVRAGWYAPGDNETTTAPRVGTDTGEIITLGMFQTTVKNYVTRYATRYANDEFCLTKWFYVPPATASLTLQQYDLDRQVDIRLRVRFYRPSDPFDPRALQGGLAPANPVSGEALWERDTFTNPEAGWWRSVVCTPYQNNAYVLDAIADGVKLPLTVNPPPPAPDLQTEASMTAEVTPTVALTLTYQNRAPLATALRPTLTVNLPPQLTFPADVCTQIADLCRLENGALIIQPARVAPGALGTYQVPVVVTPGSQGTALIQLETRFQDVMGNRYRNGSVAILTLP
ncbi:hypothetical protein EYB53_022865 [Candidatus Chloroploca sp. M-50]|uniref:Calx-beta domain-containing protein n=1 Tax=Candidatus Chloroploca mongolica TaxID=2528176 RepID=A0ABS4DGL0_9CHLR|nr:hypothetical protein [Candidatus Chloroploca mongolica]